MAVPRSCSLTNCFKVFLWTYYKGYVIECFSCAKVKRTDSLHRNGRREGKSARRRDKCWSLSAPVVICEVKWQNWLFVFVEAARKIHARYGQEVAQYIWGFIYMMKWKWCWGTGQVVSMKHWCPKPWCCSLPHRDPGISRQELSLGHGHRHSAHIFVTQNYSFLWRAAQELARSQGACWVSSLLVTR